MPHPEKEARLKEIEAAATELCDRLENWWFSPSVHEAETKLRALLGLPKLDR